MTILNSKAPSPIVNIALMGIPLLGLIHTASVFKLMWILIQGSEGGSLLLWLVIWGGTVGLLGALAGAAFGPPPLPRR